MTWSRFVFVGFFLTHLWEKSPWGPRLTWRPPRPHRARAATSLLKSVRGGQEGGSDTQPREANSASASKLTIVPRAAGEHLHTTHTLKSDRRSGNNTAPRAPVDGYQKFQRWTVNERRGKVPQADAEPGLLVEGCFPNWTGLLSFPRSPGNLQYTNNVFEKYSNWVIRSKVVLLSTVAHPVG